MINRYCWDDKKGLYRDYDFINKRFSQTASVITFYPLWAGIAAKDQVAKVVANLSVFEYEYGPTVCEKNSRENQYQWDYPTGWPPIYYLVIKGLDNYGYKREARRIAAKYLDVVAKNFFNPQPAVYFGSDGKKERRTAGHVYEKYNVTNGAIYDAEYASRPFHGWSYGVFIWCLNYLRQE